MIFIVNWFLNWLLTLAMKVLTIRKIDF